MSNTETTPVEYSSETDDLDKEFAAMVSYSGIAAAVRQAREEALQRPLQGQSQGQGYN